MAMEELSTTKRIEYVFDRVGSIRHGIMETEGQYVPYSYILEILDQVGALAKVCQQLSDSVDSAWRAINDLQCYHN